MLPIKFKNSFLPFYKEEQMAYIDYIEVKSVFQGEFESVAIGETRSP